MAQDALAVLGEPAASLLTRHGVRFHVKHDAGVTWYNMEKCPACGHGGYQCGVSESVGADGKLYHGVKCWHVADNLYDNRLDRSYDYDHVGRLTVAYTGMDARAHAGLPGSTWGVQDGPYAFPQGYDEWGNMTSRQGWGSENPWFSTSYTNNRRNGFSYDAAGNVTGDGGQTFTYDATGQQATASYSGYSLQQRYDGDGLRVKKTENGDSTYYVRSAVLGGQVLMEIKNWGAGWSWFRGYVYGKGGELLAVQHGGAFWVHQDPVTKSQRVTDSLGNVTAGIEMDPWGGLANGAWSWNTVQQPRKYTTYERDGNWSDEAMMRRYNRWHARFDQPDPWDGAYDPSDPQSFNRYAYTQNDPVNLTDPTGLDPCIDVDSGREVPCPSEEELAQQEVIRTYVWAKAWPYFLPAPSSGYRPMFFNPLPGPRAFAPPEPPQTTPVVDPPRQVYRHDPCKEAATMNVGVSGGIYLMGGSASVQIAYSGIYIQVGGGTAISPQTTRNGFRSPIRGKGAVRAGATPFIRFSRSAPSEGWGASMDFGPYATNIDSKNNVSHEAGFAVPTFGQQPTYTFRAINQNNCP